MIFDTHTHINDLKFEEDLDEVLGRAKKEDVKWLNIVSWDKDSSYKALEIAKKYSKEYDLNFLVSIGVHPENLLEMKDEDKDLNWIYELLSDEENKKYICAIGEIGYDLYWDKSYVEMQTEYFKRQIEIACEMDLPIVIHSREASKLTFDLIKETKEKHKNLRGVFHCYSGSLEMALEIVKLDFLIGIGGVLTFKNSNLYKVLLGLDTKYIVCETDCPYLAPSPYRGKRNEPAYVREVVKKINELLGKDVEEEVFENSLKLFGR